MNATSGNLKRYCIPIDKCCELYAELVLLVVKERILTYPEFRYAVVLRVRVTMLLY